jgi:hypothetical protein
MAWIHSRFGVVAVLFAWPLAASMTACTSSNSSEPGADGGPSADGSGPTGDDAGSSLPDAGASTCSPANVQSYSPRWTPPKPHSSSCTADQIASYATCLTPPNDTTSPACAPWFGADASANSDCHTCLDDSSNTDPSWGPVVDTGSVRQINIPGCMALVSGDTGGTGCAGQYQALEGCESAACATNCTNASSTQLNACVSAADNGGCSNLLTAAECVNDAGAADQCFGPQNATFTTILTSVATVFCLSTGDAGPPDSGESSSDAGDAGDGG